MKLREFVNNYVCPNTLIRLWYPIKGGHEMAYPKEIMDWQITKEETLLQPYLDCKVVGVTDILVKGNYKEAVNIVLKNSNLKKSINNLRGSLKNDPDYYRTWRDNLSMCIQDEYSTNVSFDINAFSNNCAHRFLQLLIS